MIRILVTGAAGQLGKCIQEIASSYSQLKFDFADKNDLDITLREKVSNFFSKNSYDFCINCAAYTNVEQAEKTPEIAYSINAEGAKNLALACKENSVKLIHISTDYVFDGEKKEGYCPKDIPNPINEYGKSKLKGEQYIQQILNKYIIIRTSWLYSEFGQNFYKTILNKANNNETIYVTDLQIGCPTNAKHLAKYIMEILANQNFEPGIQHFTDEKAMSWYEFATNIIEENNLETSTKLVVGKNYCSFAKRPKYSVLIP